MEIDPVLLYQVTSLLLSSRPEKPVDAGVIHARSFPEDDAGMLELAAELVRPTPSVPIVINGSDGTSFKDPDHRAWPGADDYEARLRKLGVKNIIRSEPAPHTQDEGVKFTQMISKYGWKEVVVINLPHYLLRSMLSFLRELERHGLSSSVKLYPAAPVSLNWRTRVTGTQGHGNAERLVQCHHELERLIDYVANYPQNFTTISKLIDYLANLNAD